MCRLRQQVLGGASCTETNDRQVPMRRGTGCVEAERRYLARWMHADGGHADARDVPLSTSLSYFEQDMMVQAVRNVDNIDSKHPLLGEGKNNRHGSRTCAMGSVALPTANAAAHPSRGWRGVIRDPQRQHPSLQPDSAGTGVQMLLRLALMSSEVVPGQAAMDLTRKGFPCHVVELSTAVTSSHRRVVDENRSTLGSLMTYRTYWSVGRSSSCMGHSVSAPE